MYVDLPTFFTVLAAAGAAIAMICGIAGVAPGAVVAGAIAAFCWAMRLISLQED